MVLSPAPRIWFLPLVLAQLPGSESVSEAWLQPLGNCPLLDQSLSWGLTVPHLSLCSAILSLVPAQSRCRFFPQEPQDLHRFSCTFLHPLGSASSSSYTSGILCPSLGPFSVLQSWPWFRLLVLVLALPSVSLSTGLAPPLGLLSFPGSSCTLRIGFASFCCYHPAYITCLILGSRDPLHFPSSGPKWGPDARGPPPHSSGPRWHRLQIQVNVSSAPSRPRWHFVLKLQIQDEPLPDSTG